VAGLAAAQSDAAPASTPSTAPTPAASAAPDYLNPTTLKNAINAVDFSYLAPQTTCVADGTTADQFECSTTSDNMIGTKSATINVSASGATYVASNIQTGRESGPDGDEGNI
jgi:hypothetical protein